jgi:hypothetical protein
MAAERAVDQTEDCELRWTHLMLRALYARVFPSPTTTIPSVLAASSLPIGFRLLSTSADASLSGNKYLRTALNSPMLCEHDVSDSKIMH